MNEWKMKECIVKTKQPNKNEHAWYLWAVSVTVSERRLRLISPGGAPRHCHSLLRPPGQTSVMASGGNLLTGEPLPQPGSSCGLSLSLWHRAWQRVGVARWAACVRELCVDARSYKRMFHCAEGPESKVTGMDCRSQALGEALSIHNTSHPTAIP